VVQAYKF